MVPAGRFCNAIHILRNLELACRHIGKKIFESPGVRITRWRDGMPPIGQGKRPNIHCPLEWGDDLADAAKNATTTAPPQAVTMKGGEYFFMPSIAFLRSL
uniref:Uncharacterized protein n=1 Tax=Rhizobium leguminosarum TaxID=384 RepID=A0A179BGH0_RHILE|nr:hypothetical protein A4U53_30325 [Rhizobium leguminosarum]